MHRYILSLLLLLGSLTAWAQGINVSPTLSADDGAYDDAVSVSATFPQGCAGGKYWFDGAEIQARPYDGPITIDYDCALSVAGTDAEGHIITDVVTRHYTINRVTPPTLVAQPAEGVRTTSFYVTRLTWDHVGRVELNLDDFKNGGKRHGEHVVWLTGPDGQLISGGDTNNLWNDGLNSYKAYIYKHYTPEQLGHYVLHIAGGIFSLDGQLYTDELQLHYDVTGGSAAPVFSPAEGTYKGSVTVTIDYPTDGTAFYRFYKLDGGKAKQYTAPLTLSATTTIEAYGMDEDFTAETPHTTAVYTLLPADPEPEVLAAPAFSLDGNTLSISGPEGATLKYWFDGRMATAQLYTAPFSVDHNGSVSCVAYTDRGVSPTVTTTISHFPNLRGERGEQVLLTPDAAETAHLMALSPNGRFAVGYIGSDTSSKGFVWDLESDEFQYASTIFLNQLWAVHDDGTAYGWRTRTTEVDESVTDADLLWGTFRDGVWTEMKREDFDGNAFPPAPAGYPAVTALSANGEWAILGSKYRYNTATGTVEYLASMSERFSSGTRPEVLTCIADDGTIFGTYDPSYFSPENGVGLVRTNDGRWRDVAEWLRDVKGLTLLDDYELTSVRAVSGDAQTLLFHAKARGQNVDDAFTRGLLLRIDVAVAHLAPASLKAEQMSGRKIVKLSWKAPLNTREDAAAPGQTVTTYIISRDGTELARVDASDRVFYDESVETGVTYTYSVRALYADGVVSSESRESSVSLAMDAHLPVRNLAYRPVGLNSLRLAWDAPIVTLPKLQYFDEQSETFAFGTGTWDAEFGIRIAASDLATFSGQQICTLQFIPTGPHKSFTLNLYRGATTSAIAYDDEPFYSQAIDPATLNYGTVNTIELTTPQPLPTDADLYVGLLIESSGNDNMLGISYEGFRSGYTDLCRIVGVHDQMVAMSQNSSQVTEVVLPIGLGIASETDFNRSIVSHYTVTDNTAPATTTQATHHVVEQLADGSHTLSVTAVYRDGVESAPATISLDMAKNEAAYVGVEPRITLAGDGSVDIDWEAPRDDDRSLIHWGDLTPAEGWPLAKGLQGFMAVAAYPVNMTAEYADDYSITGIFFCPTAEEVEYEVALGDADGNVLSYVEPHDLVIGQVNYVTLPEPVAIDPTVSYQVVVNVPYVEEGVAALAYDSSGKWQNGYSNLLNYGMGIVTLAEFVQITEHPNWLMGMTVQQNDARPMVLDGYHVTLDGVRQTAAPITATHYTATDLADGRHTAQVDVVYSSDRTVGGRLVSFATGTEGIITLTPDVEAAPSYDLLGRRQPVPFSRGINISAGRKAIR